MPGGLNEPARHGSARCLRLVVELSEAVWIDLVMHAHRFVRDDAASFVGGGWRNNTLVWDKCLYQSQGTQHGASELPRGIDASWLYRRKRVAVGGRHMGWWAERRHSTRVNIRCRALSRPVNRTTMACPWRRRL